MPCDNSSLVHLCLLPPGPNQETHQVVGQCFHGLQKLARFMTFRHTHTHTKATTFLCTTVKSHSETTLPVCIFLKALSLKQDQDMPVNSVSICEKWNEHPLGVDCDGEVMKISHWVLFS